MRLKIFEIIKRVTKERIIQIYEASSAGTLRPQLAANMLSEVCETALELFKIVEQQNVRLKNLSIVEHEQSHKTS